MAFILFRVTSQMALSDTRTAADYQFFFHPLTSCSPLLDSDIPQQDRDQVQ